MASKDYFKISKKYIKDVLEDRIPACNYVKLACERQDRDLSRSNWVNKYDKSKAERICRYVENMVHIKGIWAGKPIVAEPWQVFNLSTVFGWVDKKKDLRRFKTAYIEVPRKNAKSTISSGVGNYMLTADGEGGPEVYSAATTRDQAKIVWEDAKRMVEKNKPLQEYFGVQTSAHSIFVPGNAGVFKPLARDQGGNLDGLNIHCAIVDELHAHKTREVWDVLETATGARSQPLIWGISTAGFNRMGICYEQRAYVIKILEQTVEDEEYYGIIYTIDENDDWTDPKVWAKANPNWGVSVPPDDIARKARKAMEMAAATNNFLTKHLNVWVNADTAWMNMRAWDACADPELSEDMFLGEPCWIALDLATKTDLAVYVKLFVREGVYYLFGKYYLPEEAAEDGRSSHYQGWARQEILTLTPGNITDFEYIENDLREEARKYDIQSVAYDPWQANYLATRLMGEGLPMGEYRQTVQNMSEPMKQLEALVLSGKVKHTGCPILTWAISNVVGHLDAKENIYPRKEFPENKIDPAVASIMAIGEYMTTKEEPEVFAWSL